MCQSRPNDDSVTKISEHDSSDLKFGFKIFLTNEDPVLLIDSIEKTLITLNVASVSNVIIAFGEKKNDVSEIKSVWTALEDYVLQNKISKIGIADLEEEPFRALYDWATVKPSIIQINLSTCCVVSPTLQAFCKDNEIQLLTHSDPTDILPKSSLDIVLGKEFLLKWVVRFLVHIKCRGVLTTKGYLLSLGK
ncbi:hypothetical protein HHI36_002627 [Cryptolaemus montrouzieri]|uniref:GCS light chain n=1 Tax=Cryptolaemus montrouzieri TaxID=559131 RepID=A0ABD2PBM0_9CUCU